MNRFLIVALLFASTLAHSEPAPAAEPTGLQRRISVEFKDIQLSNLFKILGEITRQEFRLSPALAEQKATLKFHNVPVQLVLDALATQFDVRYVSEQGVIRVEPVYGARSIAELERELAQLKARVAEVERALAAAKAQ